MLDFQRATVAADKQLATEWDNALKIAMKSGNLEEAKRIDVSKKDAEKQLPAAGGASLIGTWHTRSSTGESVYQLGLNEVRHAGAHERGTPTYQGNVVTIRWPSGWVELWVLGPSHALIESSEPAHAKDAPTTTPSAFGYAERGN